MWLNVPHPIFVLWVGLVFWFRLFCSCCWDGVGEVLALKLCWDGWDGDGCVCCGFDPLGMYRVAAATAIFLVSALALLSA